MILRSMIEGRLEDIPDLTGELDLSLLCDPGLQVVFIQNLWPYCKKDKLVIRQ